jgi:hypothetical protein
VLVTHGVAGRWWLVPSVNDALLPGLGEGGSPGGSRLSPHPSGEDRDICRMSDCSGLQTNLQANAEG